ncbi:MAG: acyl-CoA synthetase [Alphaproteobacteria bacterium]|nr:acyl-CoA synthetase [Alphaproteobacteria bacterium]
MAKAKKATGRTSTKKAKTKPRPRPASKPANIYRQGLDYNSANFAPLSPISFLPRAAGIHPERVAIVHGERRITYREWYARARRLASQLAKLGVRRYDTVAAMLPNTPPMLDCHFGVPMLGAVLNTINTRLDANTIAYILDHGEAKVFVTDRQFAAQVGPALEKCKRRPIVIDVDDPLGEGLGPKLGTLDYETWLAQGDADFAWEYPPNEGDPLALNYTSGTTGNPKGVVYHHRGCYLESTGLLVGWGVPQKAVYLWALPMFHCNGWTFPWAITAVAGTHICLRAVDPAAIFRLIPEHGVTHMCGAPTVLSMLINAPMQLRRPFPHKVKIQTGGSSPPAKVIRAMNDLGFDVLHIYGLTEVQGPSTLCEAQDAWAGLSDEARAGESARQGVILPMVAGQMVADAKTLAPVPADGKTMGEVMLRGNTVMLGYLKDKNATAKAFAGGWFHSGDLGVQHADGYIEIKDRLKDIIISGGENIASIEIEAALYRHPAVALAAVVARPDDKWGETPCAFVQLKADTSATADELIAFCREHLARFKIPKTVVLGALPTTATGKIQKFVLRERAKAM